MKLSKMQQKEKLTKKLGKRKKKNMQSKWRCTRKIELQKKFCVIRLRWSGEGAAATGAGASTAHRSTPQRDLTPQPSHGATTASVLKPPSPPQSHPPSNAAASSAWPPAFHGPISSLFLFYPIIPMQQMLPHPTRFTHHNGNPAWLPQMGMVGGSDIKPRAEFTGGQLLAQDSASTALHSHGMTTCHGSSWAP